MTTVTVTVKKAKSESSGLFLYKDEKNRIIINNIFSGPFMDTDLKTSMEIISVNGISCAAMDEGFVLSLLDSASGQVTVVAQQAVYSAVVVNGDGQPTSSTPQPSAPPPPPAVPQYSQSQQPAYVNGSNITPVANVGSPPQGCQAGGRWATVRYGGEKTWILCVVLAFCFNIYSGCGACAFLCPQDKMDVYVVDRNVYDRNGKFLGNVSKFKFC